MTYRREVLLDDVIDNLKMNPEYYATSGALTFAIDDVAFPDMFKDAQKLGLL